MSNETIKQLARRCESIYERMSKLQRELEEAKQELIDLSADIVEMVGGGK